MVVSYLTLMTEAAPQREYSLRAMCNALRWMARTGASWRMWPQDFPPWAAVYQQTQRWLRRIERRWSHTRADDVRWVLVDASSAVLPELGPDLGRRTLALLRRRHAEATQPCR